MAKDFLLTKEAKGSGYGIGCGSGCGSLEHEDTANTKKASLLGVGLVKGAY
jgi:hypothetical protein